jgi:hypothetical protein
MIFCGERFCIILSTIMADFYDTVVSVPLTVKTFAGVVAVFRRA